ncbi:MAG: hypothetical protein CBB60_009000 [Armatimonadetes bacterium Cent15-Ar3]|jgi:MFS family permease|nr:MAG: hypothetical protein CBB60_009000 [Armatimonadetes bacterium Cent15-Ar3]
MQSSPALGSPKDVLSIRDFRNLWIGQAISRIGDALYFLGPLFVVKKLFNDDAMVGYVGALEAVPWLLFGTFAGAMADRMDRKKLLVWSDLLSTIVLVAFLVYLLLLQGDPPRWPFYVFGPLLATLRVFFMPAKNAVIPRLVPPEKLMGANAFSAATDQFAWLLGNMLTALLGSIVESFSPGRFLQVMVIANALTFAVSVWFLVKLPSVEPERDNIHESHMFQDVVKGIEYARKDEVIGLSLLASFGLALFMSPFFVVYFAINQQWFDNKVATVALIEGCFIVGMLAMSFIVPKMKFHRPGLAYSLGLGLAGVMVVFMGFSPFVTLYAFWNLVCGFAIGAVDVPMRTYQQLKVPDEYRGRIMSLGMLIWMSVQPFGMALGGAILKILGPVLMHMVMGLGFAFTGLAPLMSKAFREATLPDISAQQQEDILEKSELEEAQIR